MNALLIDLGNTRLKWARADAQGFEAGTPVAHAEPGWTRELARAWSSIAAPEVVLLAAVARAEVVEATIAAVRVAFPAARVERVQARRAALGMRTAYEEPARLGVDRFLGVLAAWRRGIAPALVVGVGTAVTVDAVERDGLHRGGWIAPSPRLMRKAVVGDTAGVTWNEGALVVDFATTTEDALESGCWGATAGLVERCFGKLRDSSAVAPRVLLTGGDAARLASMLAIPHELATGLVLEGLWQLACAGEAGTATEPEDALG